MSKGFYEWIHAAFEKGNISKSGEIAKTSRTQALKKMGYTIKIRFKGLEFEL